MSSSIRFVVMAALVSAGGCDWLGSHQSAPSPAPAASASVTPQGASVQVVGSGGAVMARSDGTNQVVTVGGPQGGVRVAQNPGGSTIQLGGPGGGLVIGTGGVAITGTATGSGGTGPSVVVGQPPGSAPTPAPTPTPTPTAGPTPGAGNHAPIVCSGNEHVTETGIVIDAGAQPAIEASGDCEVVCSNCTLRSQAIAVNVSGSAEVVLNGCHVTGGQMSLMVTGSGELTSNSSTIEGPTHRSGSGELTVH